MLVLYARRCKASLPTMKGSLVTVFQSKRQRLAIRCTIHTCRTCVLRCVAFFESMICRLIMTKKFSGDSRLLPRFIHRYVPKYVERRVYCIFAKCSTSSKLSLCCHHMSFFRSNVPKNLLWPHSLDAFCVIDIDMKHLASKMQVMNLVACQLSVVAPFRLPVLRSGTAYQMTSPPLCPCQPSGAI